MARTTAINYTALGAAGTDFNYTDAANDPYLRSELQKLGKAVDLHDHASGRGLAVARLAAGSISASNLFAAGVVDPAALAALAVIAGKIAAGGVVAGNIAAGGISASNQFAAGVVNTAAVAANAITQLGYAVGSTSGPTTTSGSFVDIPEMSVTLTTAGGDLLAIMSITVANSTNNIYGVALSLDGGAATQERNGSDTDTKTLMTVHRFTGVSAASHTVKGRWFTSGGTLTADATKRSLLLVEVKR